MPILAIARTFTGMATINISLSDDLRAYVETQVAARGYVGASEFLRELIRADRDRQALRALLLEGAEGPDEPADEAFFDALHDEIRNAGAA